MATKKKATKKKAAKKKTATKKKVTKKFSWATYTSHLVQAVERTLRKTILKRPKESFYAAAFHSFYAEDEGPIGVPLLGLNSEEAWEAGHGRWSPPDWYWEDLRFADREFSRLHGALGREATRNGHEHWQRTHARFMDTMVKASRALTSKLKGVSNDFCVVVLDEESPAGEELLLRCLGKARYRHLFETDRERVQDAGASVDDSWKEELGHDLSENVEKVVARGKSAIPPLLKALKDTEQGGEAASILGYLQVPDQRVIAALRERTLTGNDEYYRSAWSLALLGDIDFLLKISNDRKTAGIARSGFQGLYSHWVSYCDPYLPLDLRPLESFLANGSKPTIKDLWAGGRDIHAGDIDEVLRGLSSKHGVIREFACATLSKDKFKKGRLGARDKQRVLAALAERTQDKHVGTRRRALYALGDWGAAAKAHIQVIRRALQDSNANVVLAAESCLEDVR